MNRDKANHAYKLKENANIFGRTASYVPLIHLADKKKTRMTYAKILEILALSSDSHTATEFRDIIAREAKVEPTLGFPLPSRNSEWRRDKDDIDVVFPFFSG